MPSPVHEMLVELFVARPALAPEMLADVLGMDLPRFDGTAVTSADATEAPPPSTGRMRWSPSPRAADRCSP